MKNVYEYDGRGCEICNDDRIYYISDPKDVGPLERTWLNNLKKEIAEQSEFEHNIICNLTWFRANEDETVPLINFAKNLGPKEHVKLWYVGSVDGNYWITQDHIVFYQYFLREGYTFSFVGYSREHWHSWYPGWFINHNTKTNINDILLNEGPNNLYLCYNRKPRLHRTWLVDSLVKNKLLNRGWVTFEKGHYPEIDARSAETDQEKHSSDTRFSRPEDILSLGDLDIWRNSYLILVSETDHADPWQLSEKTWKPIFGLRPFLLNGGKELYDILEKLGFYTPKDFFKNSKLECNHLSIAEQLKKLYFLSPNRLYELWLSQYDMLIYNRRRMFEMAYSDPEKILNWPQAKSKP